MVVAANLVIIRMVFILSSLLPTIGVEITNNQIVPHLGLKITNNQYTSNQYPLT
jgi:hypothetical protein